MSDVLEPDDPAGGGCCYTHVTLASGITQGAILARGQDVGDVVEVPGIPPHLHFAIAERRGGTNFGIDIFDLLIASANSSDVARLTFFQHGRPPDSVFPV